MATPNKSEIEEKARELWHSDRFRGGDPSFEVSPELDELREEGYLSLAQSYLMRDRAKSEIEEYEGYNDLADLDDYPIKEIMREGGFVIGGRGSGKTNLLKLLAYEALRIGVKVKVVDSALNWRDFPLPTIKVRRKSTIVVKLNRVYDVSRLAVLEIRNFVSEMMKRDFEEAVALKDAKLEPIPLLYILEEIQNVIPSNTLRTLKFLEVSRFVTQGRNFGLSYLASVQRLSTTDTTLVEISGVKFWLKLEGENNLRKARSWLPKFVVWRLRDLEVGSAYLQIGSKVKLLRLPLFETKKVIAK